MLLFQAQHSADLAEASTMFLSARHCRVSLSKMDVDEEVIYLLEGFQGVQGIDSLIFFRLVGVNCRSAMLAQFMLFLSQSKEKELNKTTVSK